MTLASRFRSEAPALAALAALAAAQLWPAVGPGRLPESLDLMLQYVPNAAFLQRSLRDGAIPLWNPYLGAGMPFAADPGAGVWYVPSWILLGALPLYAAVRTSLWLHLLWAAVGQYAVCRVTVGTGRLAAFVGAIAFALTTWLPGLTGMPAVLTSVAWLPWIVLLGDLAARRGGRWIVALALAGALQLVSGWPAGAYLAWLTLGLLLVGRGPTRIGVGRATGAGVCAALLGGVLLLPAFELIGESSYAETRSVQDAGRESYLTLLSWLRPAGGTGSLESSQLYVGLAAIVLALIGALSRERLSPTLSLIAVFALVVAMGTRTPLFSALYAWLPGFRVVYLPARIGIVASFAIATLAALGLERLASGTLTRRTAAIVTVGTLALVPATLAQFWLSEGYDSFRRLLTNLGRVSGAPYLSVAQEAQYVVFGALSLTAVWLVRRHRVALTALLVCDVLVSHQLSRPPAVDPAGWYAPAIETAERLRTPLGSERVVGSQWHGETHFLTDFPRSANPAQLPPNLSLLVGLRDVQGYNPLLLRRAAEYFALVNERETGGAPPDDHWLWVQDFAGPSFNGLAPARVLAPMTEWRVRSHRLVGSTSIPAGTAIRINVPALPSVASRLHVVSYLGEAIQVPHGETVGEVRITASNTIQTSPLRAGLETAEWAYGRPDVQLSVLHRQAPIALRTQLVDAVEGRFWVYEYRATFDLVPGSPPTSIEIASLLPAGASTSLTLSGVWVETPGTYPAAEVGALRSVGAQPRLRATAGTARITGETDQRIEAIVESASGATVTLADAFYPGWVARLDSAPIAIDVADGLFRQVQVPGGRHTLVFSYEPLSLTVGAAVSLLGALLTGAVAFGRWPSRPSTISNSVRRKTSRPNRLARSAAR